jgi:hypothetical protein
MQKKILGRGNHLLAFTPKKIKKISQMAGIEIIRMGTWTRHYEVRNFKIPLPYFGIYVYGKKKGDWEAKMPT